MAQIDADEKIMGVPFSSLGKQNGTISDFIGCLSRHNARPLTIDEINDVAAQGWTGEKGKSARLLS